MPAFQHAPSPRPNKTSLSRSLRFAARLSLRLAVGLAFIGGACLSEASNEPQPSAPRPPLPAPGKATSISREQDTPAAPASLTLQQAIQLAVQRHPELEAHAWDAQSAVDRIRQARLWPNPELEFERENFGGSGQFSGSDSAEDTLSLAQTLPLNGEIRNRRRIAEAASDQAAWAYHATRLDLILETTHRFIEALAAERRFALATQELELAQSVEDITSKRVDAGDASPVELSRAVVPVVSAELALANAKLAKKATRRRLALSWGDRSGRLENLSGDLDALQPLPQPDALVARINNSPEVARWTAEISAASAKRRLARSQILPNPTLRFGVKEDNRSGDEGLIAGVSLPLPLFDRNQGNIPAAQSAQRAAEDRKRAAELRIESALSASYLALATAHAEATALRQRALPAAQKAYDATRRAFAEGELPYLDVLDAQRTLFELQHRYLDALVAYHLASAELEALLGGSITESN